MTITYQSHSEEETHSLAKRLAQRCEPNIPVVIYLYGELGAGKTTFTRGFINYFGEYIVKSPTYSLVESYETTLGVIHHFDLYRIHDPEELDYIGIREYTTAHCIFEWPDMGQGVIPSADINISLSDGTDKTIILEPLTLTGTQLLYDW